MEEVEETVVWGSTDSIGGNDLVNVALVVRKGSLVSKEEVVAKVAATLHPRKQITGQVKYKSKFQIFHLGKSQFRKKKKMPNYSGGFPRWNPAQPTGEETSAPVEGNLLSVALTHLISMSCNWSLEKLFMKN